MDQTDTDANTNIEEFERSLLGQQLSFDDLEDEDLTTSVDQVQDKVGKGGKGDSSDNPHCPKGEAFDLPNVDDLADALADALWAKSDHPALTDLNRVARMAVNRAQTRRAGSLKLHLFGHL